MAIDPTAAGIDSAQKLFDAKKPSLTTKWNGIKDAVGFQVGAETKKKLEDSMKNNVQALSEVSTKNAMKWAMEKDAIPKFQKLMTDYTNTFTEPGAAK